MTTYHTGDKVRVLASGSEGVVIEDLNEVVSRENKHASKPDLRPRDLVLVKTVNGQTWLRYNEVERI